MNIWIFPYFISFLVLGLLIFRSKKIANSLMATLLFVGTLNADIPLPGLEIIKYAGGAAFGKIFLFDVVLLLCVCFLFLTGSMDLKLFKSNLFILLILIFCVEMLSVLGEENLGLGVFQLLQSLKGIVYIIVLFNFIKNDEKLLFVSRVLLYILLFHTTVAMLEFFKGGNVGLSVLGENVQIPGNITEEGTIASAVQVTGLTGGANTFGIFLLMMIPYSIACYLSKIRFINKKLNGMICILAFFVSMSIMSKAIMLIMPIGVLITFFFCYGKNVRSSRIVYFSLFLCSILLFGYLSFRDVIMDQFFGISHNIFFSLAKRMEYIRVAILEISQNPILGVGLNNHAFLFKGSGLIPAHSAIHNYYLHIAAESGLSALFLFLCLMLSLFKTLMALRKSEIEMIRTLSAGILSGMICLSIAILVFWSLKRQSAFFIFCTMIGITIKLGEMKRKMRQVNSEIGNSENVILQGITY